MTLDEIGFQYHGLEMLVRNDDWSPNTCRRSRWAYLGRSNRDRSTGSTGLLLLVIDSQSEGIGPLSQVGQSQGIRGCARHIARLGAVP